MTTELNTLPLREMADQVSRAMMDMVNPDTGEVTAEAWEWIEALNGAIEEKIDSYAYVIRWLHAQSTAVKMEADYLRGRANAIEKRAESLEMYCQATMERLGIQKVDRTYKTSLAKCPASVNIVDEAVIPAEFFREKTVKSVDKDAVKKALQSGASVTGAVLVSDKVRLSIR